MFEADASSFAAALVSFTLACSQLDRSSNLTLALALRRMRSLRCIVRRRSGSIILFLKALYQHVSCCGGGNGPRHQCCRQLDSSSSSPLRLVLHRIPSPLVRHRIMYHGQPLAERPPNRRSWWYRRLLPPPKLSVTLQQQKSHCSVFHELDGSKVQFAFVLVRVMNQCRLSSFMFSGPIMTGVSVFDNSIMTQLVSAGPLMSRAAAPPLPSLERW